MQPMSAFSYWLRTGRRPSDGCELELKFNPWHDPDDGRFTFANQGRYFGHGTSSAVSRQSLQSRRGRSPPNLSLNTQASHPSNSHQNSVQFLGNAQTAIERFNQEAGARGTQRGASTEVLVQKFKWHMIPKEGDRNDVYSDSRGIPTVGIGHKVVPKDKLKLGDRITDAEKEALWRQDSAKALQASIHQAKQAGISDPDFIVALADVNFQLGNNWYNEHRRTWSLITKGNYGAAAREVQNSDWYRQTPTRAKAFQRALLALHRKSAK